MVPTMLFHSPGKKPNEGDRKQEKHAIANKTTYRKAIKDFAMSVNRQQRLPRQTPKDIEHTKLPSAISCTP
jgi:hypothetical protein